MTAEFKAGIFVLMSAAALVFATTKLTEDRYSAKGTKRYFAHLKDATGLLAKTKIKMAGLDVGHVETVELVENHAKITVAISSEIQMKKDGKVTVKSIGFLGDKYIELYAGSDKAPPLDEGGTLAEGTATGGIEELTNKTSEVMDNIKEITALLKDALKGQGDDEDSRLDRILDNMENFTAGLSSIEKYGELADRLNEVAVNVREITDKIKRGEGTVGKLLTDSETIDKLNSTLSGVNKFITKADRTSLIIDAHGGMLSSGGSKTYFSLSFLPTYDKFYLLGVNAGPRSSSTVTKTTTTDAQGNVTGVSTKDEQNPNALFFNAQFGKRFNSDTVVRLGLFETTGGFAVDQYFMNDSLKIYGEAYRFGKTAGNPALAQINLGAEYVVYKPFYLWGGVDDAINSTYRNFVVGAGLRFTDNDLKTFATLGASAAASSK